MITLVPDLNEGIFALAMGSALLSRRSLLVAVMLSAVMISALAVVYVQEKNRTLFTELQILQQARGELHVEWGQLLLEQSTWATQSRIQQISEGQLKMAVPEQEAIIITRK